MQSSRLSSPKPRSGAPGAGSRRIGDDSTHPMIRRPAVAWVALVALALLLASCSGSAASSVAPTLTITAPWILVSGGIDQPAAGYLTITNAGTSADALASASSPGAASVELHQSAMDASGMMGMMPVDRIEVPAGGSVSLAPGGYHLMISRLKAQLTAGARFELDLVFDHAGTIVVEAEVRRG
jgi:copper(I)-binding protein